MIKIKDIIKDLELGKVYTDKDRPPFQAESINEDDLGLTYKKGKTVKVKHKTSGKSIVITDKPDVIKKYEKLGFFAEGTTTPFPSALIDKAIKVAKSMGGNMTGAVKKIEKIKKGLSKNGRVEYALRKANESVNEGIFSSWLVKKAIELADKMGGNMTGAVKKIEKLKRGLSKDKQVVKALRLANESVNEAGNDDRKWSMYVDDKKIKTYKSKRAAVIAYNKLVRDTDNWDEVSIKLESVNENQKRQATDIAAKFDNAYLNFSREIRDIIKMVVRITGSNTDGKIFNNAYKKHLIPFNKLFMSWYKGQQSNPHIDEKVASPFSDHLRKAQNEIEYMISEHNDAEGEGVYSKPHEAIKLLQIAQKSLGKIK